MSGKETILIVEDNNDLRNGLREILIFEGYTVLAGSNGSEGLQQMDLLTPDLILSDITMPEMDGYEFFSAVRARPEGVTIPFLFLTARGDREEVARGKSLGVEDYLIKPLTRSELLSAVQSRLTRFHQLELAQLEQAYQSSLILLANAIELRDQYTRGHIERVTEYSIALGGEMGFSGKRLDILRFGAILHDIGKILVDPNVWIKAGPLTNDERYAINQHTTRGADMIRDITYLAPAVPAIRYHHERWNGTGYPEGLRGEEIPLDARIITVVDSFDAITTTRPYHDAWSMQRGLEEILQGSGTLYDPEVVLAFQRCWDAKTIYTIAMQWGIVSIIEGV